MDKARTLTSQRHSAVTPAAALSAAGDVANVNRRNASDTPAETAGITYQFYMEQGRERLEEVWQQRPYQKSAFFFLVPSIIFALILSLSRSVDVTQVQGHSRGSFPPSRLLYVPSFLSREDFSPFFPRQLASISNCCVMNADYISATRKALLYTPPRRKCNITKVPGIVPGIDHGRKR